MCLNIITQIGPYLVVLLLLKYLVNLQQKRAKEREEETIKKKLKPIGGNKSSCWIALATVAPPKRNTANTKNIVSTFSVFII